MHETWRTIERQLPRETRPAAAEELRLLTAPERARRRYGETVAAAREGAVSLLPPDLGDRADIITALSLFLLAADLAGVGGPGYLGGPGCATSRLLPVLSGRALGKGRWQASDGAAWAAACRRAAEDLAASLCGPGVDLGAVVEAAAAGYIPGPGAAGEPHLFIDAAPSGRLWARFAGGTAIPLDRLPAEWKAAVCGRGARLLLGYPPLPGGWPVATARDEEDARATWARLKALGWNAPGRAARLAGARAVALKAVAAAYNGGEAVRARRRAEQWWRRLRAAENLASAVSRDKWLGWAAARDRAETEGWAVFPGHFYPEPEGEKQAREAARRWAARRLQAA